MQKINAQELQDKLAEGDPLALVEVLPPDAYERGHLPGAMNLPLDPQFESKAEHALPDKSQTIVVYCSDRDCDTSTEAARRLEALGYQQVVDFPDGKEAWRRRGLSLESSWRQQG